MGRDRVAYVDYEIRGAGGELLGLVSSAYHLHAGMDVYVCREQDHGWKRHVYVTRLTWPPDVRLLVNTLDLFAVTSVRKPA